MKPPHKTCISPIEAAETLGVCKTSIYRLLREGENTIPHIRVGRRILIPVSELDGWVKQASTKHFNYKK